MKKVVFFVAAAIYRAADKCILYWQRDKIVIPDLIWNRRRGIKQKNNKLQLNYKKQLKK